VSFGFVGLHHRADGSSRSIRPGFRTLVPAVSRQRNAPRTESDRACAGQWADWGNCARELESSTYAAISWGSLGSMAEAAGLTCGGPAVWPDWPAGLVPAITRGSPHDLARLWQDLFLRPSGGYCTGAMRGCWVSPPSEVVDVSGTHGTWEDSQRKRTSGVAGLSSLPACAGAAISECRHRLSTWQRGLNCRPLSGAPARSGP
jgi:hypothetical protein